MHRIARILFYLYVIILISVCGIVLADSKKLKHPGRVVDMKTGKPLSVDVKAWPESKKTGDEGGCPLYGTSPLDSTTSDIGNNGKFDLKIDASNPTYTTTYCAADVFPRADRDIRNEKDGSPVVPIPVNVLKRETDMATYASIVKFKIIGILSDLSYLERSNPKMYKQAIVALAEDIGSTSPNRVKMLYQLQNVVQNWNH